MRNALIISLNFNPGHISHLIASYHQCEELGFEAAYYVGSAFVPFLPSGSRIIVAGDKLIPQVSLAFFLFPSQRNLSLIRRLKHQGAKVLYVFHEPLAPMKEYREAGFSYMQLVRLWIINQVSALTVRRSDAILLPSKKAFKLYQANSLYCNENIFYLPLLFDDERVVRLASLSRPFFSYIGTIAADHSFNEYLGFVEWALKENRLMGVRFLIATKSQFDIPSLFLTSSRVVIEKGQPLSNDEINECYSSSFAVWNAYTRTTQSGVLAKSFMFGTPAIVLRRNLSEFTEDGKEVVAIDNNESFEEIEHALSIILDNFDSFSTNARKRFDECFFYKNYNKRLKEIIDSLLQ